MACDAEGFLERFLLPLVAGGQVHVGVPLDAHALDALRAACATPSDVTVRIEAVRGEAAAGCWLYPVQTEIDEESLRLAVGLHNALFLGHPASRRWSARERSIARVIAFSAECLRIGPPVNEQQLVARHSLLSGLGELRRTDIELRFWAGRRFYSGMEPPVRMLAWSNARRVEQRQQRVEWLGSELTDAQRELVDLLLWQSPLTALLTPERRFPVFTLATLYPYLCDRAICRVVCQRYLELGLDRVGPLLARDFWQLAAAPSAPSQAMTPEKRRWLEQAAQRWGGEDAPGGPAPTTLRLVAGLVQYLYAAESLRAEPPLPEGSVDPTAVLLPVLVAADACGLLAEVDPPSAVASRMSALLDRGRLAVGREPLQRLTATLRSALR